MSQRVHPELLPESEAARAYDRAAVALHGDFARLNFPEEWVTGQWKPVNEDA